MFKKLEQKLAAKMSSQGNSNSNSNSNNPAASQQYTSDQSQYDQQQQYGQPPLPQRTNEAPPNIQANRQQQDTNLLPQGQERSEQIEYFQSYEANANQTEDDQNQAILQREFPTIDSSLIAAIYNDSQSLSATREMLMELTSQS